MTLRPLAAAALVFAATTGARAQPETAPLVLPDTVRLEDALKIFRQRGLDLLIADAAVYGAEGDVKVAGAVPNPNWTAGYYRLLFQNDIFETHDGWFVGIGDSNALEDSLSGKRGLRLKVARAALAAARMSRADAQRTLELTVKTAYITAVQARDSLDFALQVQEASNRVFGLNQARYNAGAISEADLAKIETAKLEADQAVDTSEQALRAAKVQLAFLLGVRGRVPDYKVDQDLPKFFVPAPLANVTAASLIEDAIQHRPDLRAIAYQRDRAQAAVALAKRLRFPDLSLNFQYAQEGSPTGKPVGPQQLSNGAGMPVDVYAPGATLTPAQPPTLTFNLAGTLPLFYFQAGEMRKAEADYRTQQLQRAKIEAQVVADVEAAYNAFAGSRKLVERMEGRLLDRSRRARDLVSLQYTKGAASLLEYLDAQRTFIATMVEYLQDLTNYWTAVYQLESALGVELR